MIHGVQQIPGPSLHVGLRVLPVLVHAILAPGPHGRHVAEQNPGEVIL